MTAFYDHGCMTNYHVRREIKGEYITCMNISNQCFSGNLGFIFSYHFYPSLSTRTQIAGFFVETLSLLRVYRMTEGQPLSLRCKYTTRDRKPCDAAELCA